ncbi:MAG: type II secretion system protein [Alphaproteobacteria bacterium]|nr:type II secretion system protein [Alphaproteobacteria bacterium]
MKKRCGLGKKNRAEVGRSMIEMLGVLAIVGILSVGGISAFQKAMIKHKTNQVTEELSGFINELLRYSKDWKRVSPGTGGVNNDISLALDFILPAKWERKGSQIYDSMGNRFYVQRRRDVPSHPETLSFSYRFLERDTNTKINLCMAYYDMLKLYADSVSEIWLWRKGQEHIKVYGNAYCAGEKKCLKDLTLSEMRANCSVFSAEDEDCSFFIAFPI